MKLREESDYRSDPIANKNNNQASRRTQEKL